MFLLFISSINGDIKLILQDVESSQAISSISIFDPLKLGLQLFWACVNHL